MMIRDPFDEDSARRLVEGRPEASGRLARDVMRPRVPPPPVEDLRRKLEAQALVITLLVCTNVLTLAALVARLWWRG